MQQNSKPTDTQWRKLLFLLADAPCLLVPTCSSWVFDRMQEPILEDPTATVAAARALIEQQRRDPSALPERIHEVNLPPPLRVPGLKWAIVHGDHVDLVIQRSPDGPMGLRIWASETTRLHRDRPTRYAEIFRLSYSNDFPESPDNLP